MLLRLLFAGVLIVAVRTASPFAQAQTPPQLADLLAEVARYLEEYEQQSGAVVSLETYVQNAQRGSDRRVRHLKSDMLVLSVGTYGWLGFRDVFEVDGRAVRDHEERLYTLFLKPSADSLEQARKILDESARFNVGQVTRNINIPTMALTFLKRTYQPRSRFADKGIETVDGVRTRVIEFSEQASPRVISTPDGSAARGRVWVDPEQGRVVRTELMLAGAVNLLITVTYAPQDRLDGLWVPVSMRESYRRGGELTEGRATYSNFRKFNVDVSTIIK
jgi:outer membrane lipoprotein-sorting protein